MSSDTSRKAESKRIFSALFAPGLDLRARIFNALGLLGTAAGVLIAASSLVTGAGVANVVLCLVSSALAVGLIAYANRTGRFALCYRITVAVVFVLFFPVMFFAAGGYRSGMPSFFIFAILFTVFMLEGRERIPAVALEMALYVGVCLAALRWPEAVYHFETEADAAVDVIVGFATASLLLGVAMTTTLGMYEDARRKLAEKNAALERIDRRRAEFLSGVAHELKTPLSVISGYAQESAQRAAERPGLDEIGRSMRLVASEADRLALMVSQVLDVARIDEGRMRFDRRPCSLSRIVQRTLETYYPVFSGNGNTLELARGGGSPTVFCDPARVAQVLVNLIANAARHTRDGKIAISLCEHGGCAEVSLADTGCGIAPERVAELFQRFKTSNASDGGTGLGLYICKYIVEGHGGRIALESEPGRGTTVRFTLPKAGDEHKR